MFAGVRASAVKDSAINFVANLVANFVDCEFDKANDKANDKVCAEGWPTDGSFAELYVSAGFPLFNRSRGSAIYVGDVGGCILTQPRTNSLSSQKEERAGVRRPNWRSAPVSGAAMSKPARFLEFSRLILSPIGSLWAVAGQRGWGRFM
jgi:hypothetical protein